MMNGSDCKKGRCGCKYSNSDVPLKLWHVNFNLGCDLGNRLNFRNQSSRYVTKFNKLNSW